MDSGRREARLRRKEEFGSDSSASLAEKILVAASSRAEHSFLLLDVATLEYRMSLLN